MAFLLCSLPCFFNSFGVIDDAPFHLGRINSIIENLKQGNIIPTVYGDAIYGYGYGSAFFYPDLWLYVPALFSLAGLPLIRSYQLFLLLINLLVAVFFAAATRSVVTRLRLRRRWPCSVTGYGSYFEKNFSQIAAVFFLLFPYRLHDMYFRGALGETLGFVFFPLAIYGMLEILFTGKSGVKKLVAGLTGLVYSHLITLFITGILLVVIALCFYERFWKQRQLFARVLLLTFMLSALFLLPLAEQAVSNVFLFNVRQPFGLLSTHAFSTGLKIPAAAGILFSLTFITLVCSRVRRLADYGKCRELLVLYYIPVFFVFATSDLFPWQILEKLPLVSFIGFPWRLLMLAGFWGAIAFACFGIRLLENRKSLLFSASSGLFFFGAGAMVLYFANLDKEFLAGSDYRPERLNIAHAEYLPADFSLERLWKKNRRLETATGSIELLQSSKHGNDAEFRFKTDGLVEKVIFPLIYYKGYGGTLNGKRVQLFSEQGLIGIEVGKSADCTVKITYQPTATQYTGLIVTILTATVLIWRRRVFCR